MLSRRRRSSSRRFHSEMPDSEYLREEAAASYPRLTWAPSLRCVTNDMYLVLIGQLVDR